MKFVLTALLALLNVAWAVDEIKSLDLTGRSGAMNFTAVVNQGPEKVDLTFTVTNNVTAAVVDTQKLAGVDPSGGEVTRTFSSDKFVPGGNFTARVTSSLTSDPTNTETDSATFGPIDFFIKSFTLNRTNGDVATTAVVNPAGGTVDLAFRIVDVATNTTVANTVQTDNTVPSGTGDQTRPFNVTGLTGGKSYVAEVIATERVSLKKDTATIPFDVPAYSTITLKTPVLTPATSGASPKAKLTATVVEKGGTITSVKFEYGKTTTYGFEAAAAKVGSTDDYTATVEGLGADPFQRGVAYHYRASVVNTGSTTPTVSADSTFTTPANRAPIAAPDTVRLLGDSATAIDVLKNDRDLDGDTFTIISVTQGKQGRVVIEGDRVKYTPIHDATGGDTFTYTIQDNYNNPDTTADERLTATATVTINAPGLNSRGLQAAELKDADGNVVGLVRLIGTGGGAVSGKVQLYSKTYTVQGEIDANGHFYFTIPQGDNPPLQLDVDYEPDGDVAGAFSVSLASLEKKFNGTAEPNTMTDARRDEIVGKYTIEFPGGSADGQPKGTGYAQVDVKPWGEVALKGRLPDGTKFSTKGVLAGSDATPAVTLWFTPEENRVGLKFTFGTGTDPTIAGQMSWFRSQDRNADFFPDGFFLEPNITGSRFTPPDPRNRTLDGASKATLVLKDGNITTDISQQLEISKSDRVNFLNSNPFGMSLQINRENGTFKGQFDHPFDDSRRKFNGVILQSQDKGSGMFVGIDQTGSATLTIGITNTPSTGGNGGTGNGGTGNGGTGNGGTGNGGTGNGGTGNGGTGTGGTGTGGTGTGGTGTGGTGTGGIGGRGNTGF